MKHNRTDFLQDPSFEQLLKQSLLDNNKHPLNEKTIEMNANYIFSQPTTGLSTERLETLLNRHQLDISKTYSQLQFVLRWVAPIILLISIAYFANQKFNKDPKQNFVPPVTERIERDTTQFESLNTPLIQTLETKEIYQEIALTQNKDNEPEIKPRKKSKASRYTYKDKPIVTPNIKLSYPDLYEAPAPLFNMVASPDDFTLISSAFKIYGGHEIFSIKDLDYFHSYYLGQPFKEGMDDFVWVNPAKDITSREGHTSYYVQELDSLREFQRIKKNQLLKIPNVLKFHLEDYELSEYNKMQIKELSKKQLDLLLKPFYFSKYEVSVKEYRAFTNWVLKSNGYEELPYELDTIPNKRVVQLEISYSENAAKYRAFYVKWNLDKNKAYSYTFYNPSDKTLKAIGGNKLGIAPKDSIFQKRLNQYRMDYEINPFYGPNARETFEELQNRPIVGISYYQALAFLDWKTHFHQEQLDNDGINYAIEYTLPNTLEKDITLDLFNTKQTWLTDLHIENYTKTTLDVLVSPNKVNSSKTIELNRVNPSSKYYKGETIKHKLRNGITWLDGNASEWMADSYQNNWTKALSAHRKMTEYSEENELTKSIEDYYNRKNDTLGQLVMGGNYVDYRDDFLMNYYSQLNRAGTYLKTFADPHQQYSTVGFRYIIKVRDTDEARKEKLLSLLGSFDYEKYKGFPEEYMDNFKSLDDGKYFLDKEVTNGMWRSFLMDLLESGRDNEAKLCLPESELWSKYNDEYIYYFRELKYDALPVVNISHEAVQIFNQWITDKFNSYALRKFSVVEFVLPTDTEWKKVSISEFIHKGTKPWFFKGEFLANLNISPYENNNFIFPTDSFQNHIHNSKTLKGLLESGEIKEDERISFYEDFLLNKISYSDFINKVNRDWMTSEKLKIYYSEDDIKKIQKDKSLFEEQRILSIGGIFPPFRAGLAAEKSNGIYDLMGNVAEMVKSPLITKGGSWNSLANLAGKRNSEPWNGKASPMVGFRPMMKIIKKGFDHNTKIKPTKNPPGTVLLTPNYGVDKAEIRNIDYREYLYYIKTLHGIESPEYKTLLPDSTIWDKNQILTDDSVKLNYHLPLSSFYFNHSAYKSYPVVGLSYQQAQSYCKWRSDRVNERYAIYHAKNPNDKSFPKKMTYRLPSPEEWENFSIIDSVYSASEDKIRKIRKNHLRYDLTNRVMLNPPNSIGLCDLDGNVSEMTSEEGLAKGEHWAQAFLKTTGKDVKYKKPKAWIGFRCVVDVEY